MSSIHSLGVSSLIAGSGIGLSSSVGNVTIYTTGQQGGASVAGVSSQVQYNSGNLLAANSGFTYDGNQTLILGGNEAANLNSCLVLTHYNNYGYAGFFGNYGGVPYVGTTNTNRQVNIAAVMNTYTGGNPSFAQAYVTVNCISASPPTMCFGNGYGGGSDNSNGQIQLNPQTGPSYGIAWGNDSTPTTIYRYSAGVLAVGGNILLGSVANTNATNGWPYLPSTNGAPTGTPANTPAGFVPIQMDTGNGKLWAYYGSAWHYTIMT